MPQLAEYRALAEGFAEDLQVTESRIFVTVQEMEKVVSLEEVFVRSESEKPDIEDVQSGYNNLDRATKDKFVDP